MHIQRIKLPSFRNLKSFEMSFTAEAKDSDGSLRTFHNHAIIGSNGAGKSNLIEAIIIIFRDLDLNNKAPFDYEIDYDIREFKIEIKASINKRPTVIIDGIRSSAKQLSDEGRTYLPSNVFVYYSGQNERIEQLFQAHQDRFNKRMEVYDDEYLPSSLLTDFTGQEAQIQAISDHKIRIDRKRDKLGEDQLRRLFYCYGGSSKLVLLSCLIFKKETFAQLLSDLDIRDLESALFILKQPYRLKQNLSEKDIIEGDDRFWYAKGEVIREFLDKLWPLSMAPIEHTVSVPVGFRGRTEKQEQKYMFLPDKESLLNLGAQVGEVDRFFKYAEAAYIGDLIEDILITVSHKNHDNNIIFNQLSEGEVQLLTVLGLMHIASQDHCLFLLDEPDTHLNPIWKLRYFDEIDKVSRKNSEQTIAGTSQIIITTHDPIMIGSLRKEQVRILRRDRDKSIVETPYEHPQGMGVSGLLKSEMFGLPSTLDAPTLRQLQERNELLAKKANKGLNPEEEAKLVQLRTHLDDLGFSREYRDPLYQLFIQQMYQVRSKPLSEILTPDELREQAEIAQSIVTTIVKQERLDELNQLAEELKKGQEEDL